MFSSLHANNSVAAVTRLRDLGLDNFLIAATLRGILAQRLLRQLCPACAKAAAPTDEEAALFTGAGLAPPPELNHTTGCDACGGTGYAGRQAVFEIVEVTEDITARIGENASEQDLKRLAVPRENALFGQGLAMAAEGRTSIAEVRRVLGAA